MVEWSFLKGIFFLKWLKILDYKEMGFLNVNFVNEKSIIFNYSFVKFYVKVIIRWYVCFYFEILKICYIYEGDLF